MQGFKTLKIQDLTAIMVQLKIVDKLITAFNKKYHTDLHITGIDTLLDNLAVKAKEIENEPEIDPFSGLTMKGKK